MLAFMVDKDVLAVKVFLVSVIDKIRMAMASQHQIDVARMINYVREQGIEGWEYIDVRIERRAYWK